MAAAERGLPLECEIVAFGAEEGAVVGRDGVTLRILRGDPLNLDTLDADRIIRELAGADIVHVHKCLTLFGLFVASHARLLGRRVIGTDHDGDEANDILHAHPQFALVYDVLRAQSQFAALGFSELAVRCVVLTGPVDDTHFRLGGPEARDPKLVLAVGRIVPHKGYERIIETLPDGLCLVIAGRPYDREYRAFLQSHAAGKRVRFEEALDDAQLLELMQRAGLYVHAGTHLDCRGHFHLKPELLALTPLEFLCTGGPAFVSRAGAMRELGGLAGCTNFTGTQDLRRLFERYVSGRLETPAAAAIRSDVVGKYGLRQFGLRYLQLIEELDANPSGQQHLSAHDHRRL